LSGTIPTQLGRLANCTLFNVSSNELNGTIPTQLGNLRNCTSFDISSNVLSGTIPSQLANLSELLALIIYSNALEGTLPPHLGNLSNLMAIEMSNNFITGTIPSEFGNLAFLHIVDISGTYLCGSTIPPAWFNTTWSACNIQIPHSCNISMPPNCQTLPCDDTLECYVNSCGGNGTNSCAGGRNCQPKSPIGGYTCSDCASPFSNQGSFQCTPLFLAWLIPVIVVGIIVIIVLFVKVSGRRREYTDVDSNVTPT